MSSSVATLVNNLIQQNKVMVFSWTTCPYCTKVKNVLGEYTKFATLEMNQEENGDEIKKYISTLSGISTVPQVFVNGKFVGGCDATCAALKSGKLTF